MVCQLDKTERKETGFLQPLLTSDRPWQSTSMDFISEFSSVNGRKLTMLVVDRFSKYAMFVAAQGAGLAEEEARLFHNHMIKYFDLPKTLSLIVIHASQVDFEEYSSLCKSPVL